MSCACSTIKPRNCPRVRATARYRHWASCVLGWTSSDDSLMIPHCHCASLRGKSLRSATTHSSTTTNSLAGDISCLRDRATPKCVATLLLWMRYDGIPTLVADTYRLSTCERSSDCCGHLVASVSLDRTGDFHRTLLCRYDLPSISHFPVSYCWSIDMRELRCDILGSTDGLKPRSRRFENGSARNSVRSNQVPHTDHRNRDRVYDQWRNRLDFRGL